MTERERKRWAALLSSGSNSFAAWLERLRAAGLDPRYGLNSRHKIAHILPTEERCNRDDSNQREISEEIPAGYRLCKWCISRLDSMNV